MSRGNQNTALRSAETWKRYVHDPKPDKCFMCEENGVVIRRFNFWYIIENRYPYDTVAKVHHILVPYMHGTYTELTQSFKRELELILQRLNEEGDYDCRIENFTVGQSQPQHYHIHLITWKRV